MLRFLISRRFIAPYYLGLIWADDDFHNVAAL
jgi:hypothetical protein